ncbi:MAG: glycosyltransferase family A protein [Clostridiaceae bacterium]
MAKEKSMTFLPVLVVMPLYNARAYVQAAVESILHQTYPNWTLLIIDDGSTDGGEMLAAQYTSERVLFMQQKNSGPGAAMNRALQFALERQFPLLARMDSDDLSTPDRLEKQVDLLLRHPQAGACSANCLYLDAERGNTIGTSTVPISPRLIRWEIRQGLRGLIQGACLFRTDALKAVGGYRVQFKQAEETDLFLRLSERYDLVNAPDFLYQIRVHAGSLSLRDVHRNVLYQFYGLDCAARRNRNLPERDFGAFQSHSSALTRWRIWREERLLKLWRGSLGHQNIATRLLAAFLDPRRVAARVLRKIERY